MGLEVDGNSHTATVRQMQDRKKEAKLAELGWSVFRISNAQTEKLYLTLKLREHLTTLLATIG
jgi:very-short-patch-repair endonuclease